MSVEHRVQRSAAVRSGLIELAAQAAPRRRSMRWSVAAAVAGVLLGVGATTTAFAASGSNPFGASSMPVSSSVLSPSGTLPGAPLVSLLGEPVSFVVESDGSYPLGVAPIGATHIRITVAPIAAGSLEFGTEPLGANPTASWTALEVGTAGSTWIDVSVDDVAAVNYWPASGLVATMTLQYIEEVPTSLGINESGQTYGVPGGPDGEPDLIAAEGTDAAGNVILGFVVRADLDAFSPSADGQPATPEEAAEWAESSERDYPDGWSIPLFASDGETVIGDFVVSR